MPDDVFLKCKEYGCDEYVEYKPQRVPGVLRELRARETDVYLTCPRGHEHSYRVMESSV